MYICLASDHRVPFWVLQQIFDCYSLQIMVGVAYKFLCQVLHCENHYWSQKLQWANHLSSSGKDSAKAGKFGDRSKCFSVVDSINLGKAMWVFHLTMFLPFGFSTTSHVPAFWSDSNSFFIASAHISQSDHNCASSSDLGSNPSASIVAAPITNSTPRISSSSSSLTPAALVFKFIPTGSLGPIAWPFLELSLLHCSVVWCSW